MPLVLKKQQPQHRTNASAVRLCRAAALLSCAWALLPLRAETGHLFYPPEPKLAPVRPSTPARKSNPPTVPAVVPTPVVTPPPLAQSRSNTKKPPESSASGFIRQHQGPTVQWHPQGVRVLWPQP